MEESADRLRARVAKLEMDLEKGERSNAALRATVEGLQAQVHAATTATKEAKEDLKLEMQTREKLTQEWHKSRESLEASSRKALTEADKARSMVR